MRIQKVNIVILKILERNFFCKTPVLKKELFFLKKACNKVNLLFIFAPLLMRK